MSCWNLLGLAQLIQRNLLDSIPLFKSQISRPFFMEIIVAMFWAIWSARNNDVYLQESAPLSTCKLVFKQESDWVKLRAKRDLGLQSQLWLDNFM